MLQRKTRENYQNFSSEEKNRKCQHFCKRYRKTFIENELNEGRNYKKRQYVCSLHNNLSRNKRQKARNIETFLKKKKTKSVNMLANDIEIFLKGFNFCERTKNYFLFRSLVFLSECKIVFWGLSK